MGYVVFSTALSFQDQDDFGRPKGKLEIVKRGDPVPSYVRPFLINALSSAGMIVNTGPDHDIRPIEAEPTSPVSADNPPGPNGPALTTLEVVPTEPAEPVSRPADGRESKAKWEAYAVSIGIDQAEAESMTKADLMAAVDAREASNS